MILGPWYAMLGICLVIASFEPAAHKLLLSYTMWGANLLHGLVATSSCFFATPPGVSHYIGPSIIGAPPARVASRVMGLHPGVAPSLTACEPCVLCSQATFHPRSSASPTGISSLVLSRHGSPSSPSTPTLPINISARCCSRGTFRTVVARSRRQLLTARTPLRPS